MSILQKSSTPKYLSNKKTVTVFTVLAALFVLLSMLSILLGSTTVDLLSMLKGDNDKAYRIIMHIRLPRTVGAILSGCALAVSGVLIQAVLNNPIASPNIIGVNSGAGLAAVLLITAFPTLISYIPVAAFLGALTSCFIIYLFSLKSGADKITIALVGIAVSSILSAGINLVKILFPDSVFDADLFLIGGLSGVTLKKLILPAILIFFAVLISVILSRATDIITLGDETAQTLGINTKVFKFALLVIASVLSGSAVSFAGVIGFVGLLVPHIARKFVGTKHRLLIPAVSLMGSCLVLICDLFGRLIAAPYEVSVGIILAFLGGPFFIALIFSKRKNRYD